MNDTMIPNLRLVRNETNVAIVTPPVTVATVADLNTRSAGQYIVTELGQLVAWNGISVIGTGPIPATENTVKIVDEKATRATSKLVSSFSTLQDALVNGATQLDTPNIQTGQFQIPSGELLKGAGRNSTKIYVKPGWASGNTFIKLGQSKAGPAGSETAGDGDLFQAGEQLSHLTILNEWFTDGVRSWAEDATGLEIAGSHRYINDVTVGNFAFGIKLNGDRTHQITFNNIFLWPGAGESFAPGTGLTFKKITQDSGERITIANSSIINFAFLLRWESGGWFTKIFNTSFDYPGQHFFVADGTLAVQFSQCHLEANPGRKLFVSTLEGHNPDLGYVVFDSCTLVREPFGPDMTWEQLTGNINKGTIVFKNCDFQPSFSPAINKVVTHYKPFDGVAIVPDKVYTNECQADLQLTLQYSLDAGVTAAVYKATAEEYAKLNGLPTQLALVNCPTGTTGKLNHTVTITIPAGNSYKLSGAVPSAYTYTFLA